MSLQAARLDVGRGAPPGRSAWRPASAGAWLLAERRTELYEHTPQPPPAIREGERPYPDPGNDHCRVHDDPQQLVFHELESHRLDGAFCDAGVIDEEPRQIEKPRPVRHPARTFGESNAHAFQEMLGRGSRA